MERSGLRHEALIYRDADEFLAHAVPFLRAALETDEPALVAVRHERTVLLEGELGTDAAAIDFVAIEEIGRNPGRLMPVWRDYIDANRGRSIRGLGEPIWPGRRPAEIEECQRHEALVNIAFAAASDLSLLCPYDAAGLDDEVLATVAHSHRAVAREGVRSESDPDPAGDHFAGELPASPDSESFRFDRTGLFDVRQRVTWAAKSANLPEASSRDLIIAASELAANSIVHGGGSGALRVWHDDDHLLVEVEDRGTIADPLVGRVRPRPTQVGGRGLWLANQLCDLVQIRSRPGRTAVRLQMALA